MGRGPEHSAPLNVKYQRWQHALLHFNRSEPLNRTRRALLERILVNVHSCRTHRHGAPLAFPSSFKTMLSNWTVALNYPLPQAPFKKFNLYRGKKIFCKTGKRPWYEELFTKSSYGILRIIHPSDGLSVLPKTASLQNLDQTNLYLYSFSFRSKNISWALCAGYYRYSRTQNRFSALMELTF